MEIHESTVFAWVFWRKMKEIRVSCETFVKKSAGDSPTRDPETDPPGGEGRGGGRDRGEGRDGGGPEEEEQQKKKNLNNG